MPQPSINQTLDYAKKYAKSSRVFKMENHLSSLDYDDLEDNIVDKIDNIRKLGYKKIISNYLEKAKRKSKLGDYSGFDHYSNRIKIYSKKIDVDYPEQLKQLEKKMYPKMLKKNKKKLQSYIKSNNLEFLIMSLIKIRKASESLGKDIDDFIYDSQKHFDIEELVSLYHDNALIRAEIGNVYEVSLILKNTERYYDKLHHSYFIEKELIKDISYKNSKYNYISKEN